MCCSCLCYECVEIHLRIVFAVQTPLHQPNYSLYNEVFFWSSTVDRREKNPHFVNSNWSTYMPPRFHEMNLISLFLIILDKTIKNNFVWKEEKHFQHQEKTFLTYFLFCPSQAFSLLSKYTATIVNRYLHRWHFLHQPPGRAVDWHQRPDLPVAGQGLNLQSNGPPMCVLQFEQLIGPWPAANRHFSCPRWQLPLLSYC